MTARYLGSYSIGEVLPGAAAVAAAGAAGISAVLPTLLSQRAALESYAPSEIDFVAQIAQLETMIATLKTSIALKLSPPSLAGQLAEIASRLAALSARIGNVDAHLSIVTAFQAALAAAGIHAVSYEGALSSFGAETGAVVGSVPGSAPSDRAHAITLLTTFPATWALLASIVRVA